MPNDDWKLEWQGMPEYVQEQQKPYATITVRVPTAEALAELAEILCQPLTAKTKGIWYPQLVRGLHSSKRYKDES